MIEFTKKAGGSHYSYWMLLLLLATEHAKPLYDKRGVSEEVFWDTFSDLRIKALECMEEKGVWGTFVAFWYGLFYTCRIIKFGRLEYEDGTYNKDTPYTYGDITVTKGTPILGIHIPSGGEPFDYESRLRSYKMAYDFYSKEHGTDKLICNCGSWLLFEDYRDVFPAGSNTRDFMDDFDVCRCSVHDSFDDAWRVFGRDHSKPVEEYPENTSMRRAFKKHLLSGGRIGSGLGMLIFDGEKLVTRKDS